jgi:DNA-binding NtrC family response regulator
MTAAMIPARPQGRVMVIEDEPRMRDLLVRAMVQWGFVVSAARSGEEAIRLAHTDPPEIVVLDLNLPGIGGLECFQKLRETLPKLQGIVLTGFASVESARAAVHLDVVEFLTKPCHLGELEQALDRAMRRLTPTERLVPAAQTAASSGGASPGDEGVTLDEIERQHILATLERNNGNRTATATELGISRRTLYYKLEEYQKLGFKTP